MCDSLTGANIFYVIGELLPATEKMESAGIVVKVDKPKIEASKS
jgi:hypothetical protein